LSQRARSWNNKTKKKSNRLLDDDNEEGEEHKKIIEEAEILDKLSDCSGEVPQESTEESFFKSPSYVEPYQQSKL